MAPQININLPDQVLYRFHQAKHFFNKSITSGSDSVQQISESWKQTATQATDQAINTVNTTVEQVKSSLEQTLQTAEQIPSSTSSAIQTAISASVNDWLSQHPIFVRLLQILSWASNHPIISLIIFLFVIAILWSIIKAIVRLIETASWSILQIPFKLLLAVMKVSFLSFTKIGSFAVQKIIANQEGILKNKQSTAKQFDEDLDLLSVTENRETVNISPLSISFSEKTDTLPVLVPAETQLLHLNKQQRLTEISLRLAEIQQEQHQLLQEASELLASDKIDVTMKV